MAPNVLIITAMNCEATPFVNRYQLSKRQVSNRLYRHYQSEQISLIVTGIGKQRCQQALQQYLSQLVSQAAAWLNVGIAGGADELGVLHFPARIIDDETDAEWNLPAFTNLRSDWSLRSVSQAQTQFEPQTLYDMEGATIAAVHSRYINPFSATNPRSISLNCAKVVSDNADFEAKQLTAQRISDLLYARMDEIDPLIQNLLQTTE